MEIILWIIGIVLMLRLFSAEKREAIAITNEFRKRFSLDKNCRIRGIREIQCFSRAHTWCFIVETEEGIGAGLVCVYFQRKLKTPWHREYIYSHWFYDASPACAFELLECCRDIDSKEKSKRVDLGNIRDEPQYTLFQDNILCDHPGLSKSETRYFGVVYAHSFICDLVKETLGADHLYE
jgi:hypothetical protein